MGTLIVNNTLPLARKYHTDTPVYSSLHIEEKAIHRSYKLFYSDGYIKMTRSCSDNHWQCLRLNAFLISYFYYQESYFVLALDLALSRVETADDDERNCIILSNSKPTPQVIWSRACMHPLVFMMLEYEYPHWIFKYLEKGITVYWIPSHVGVHGNGKVDGTDNPDIFQLHKMILRNSTTFF